MAAVCTVQRTKRCVLLLYNVCWWNQTTDTQRNYSHLSHANVWCHRMRYGCGICCPPALTARDCSHARQELSAAIRGWHFICQEKRKAAVHACVHTVAVCHRAFWMGFRRRPRKLTSTGCGSKGAMPTGKALRRSISEDVNIVPPNVVSWWIRMTAVMESTSPSAIIQELKWWVLHSEYNIQFHLRFLFYGQHFYNSKTQSRGDNVGPTIPQWLCTCIWSIPSIRFLCGGLREAGLPAHPYDLSRYQCSNETERKKDKL